MLPAMAGVRPASPLVHLCAGYTARSPDRGLGTTTHAGDAVQRATPLQLADRRATVTPVDAFGT
jgi:hypothetical protein